MQYGQSGNEARIAIRGTRTNRTGAEAEQVVAIFEDGVSVPTTTQALGPYVDINRIEVLRGPQGVMYGRNAFGGVINIISNEPDPSGWDAAFEGEYGYADGTRFDAMLNVPIREPCPPVSPPGTTYIRVMSTITCWRATQMTCVIASNSTFAG